jgi:hypothetical protein
MDVYKLIFPPIKEPVVNYFSNYPDALRKAKEICESHHVNVEVVRVLGHFTNEPRWISNGVPGHE